MGSLALGLGWGRSGAGPLAGLEPRYVTLTAPLGCALYVSWDLYGPPALRRLVPLGLLATMLVLLWPNTRDGLEAGRDRNSVYFEPAIRFARNQTWSGLLRGGKDFW